PPAVRAGDDAFQNLMDKVLALRLEDGKTTVAELMILPAGFGSASIDPTGLAERKLREEILARHQNSAPRPTAGGGVEVDAWLSTADLSEILREVVAVHLPKVDRSRLNFHASVGPMVTATGRYVPDGRPRDNRPGWRHCTPEQMDQTRTA